MGKGDTDPFRNSLHVTVRSQEGHNKIPNAYVRVESDNPAYQGDPLTGYTDIEGNLFFPRVHVSLSPAVVNVDAENYNDIEGQVFHITTSPSGLIEVYLGSSITRPDKRTGIVRATEAGAFYDNQGHHLFLGTTYFPALWMWRNELDRFWENMKFLSANKVDYIRALGAVGPSHGWEDRTINPTEPEWRIDVAALTAALYEELGIRIHWTIFGGDDYVPTFSDKLSVVDRFGVALEGLEHMILGVELANEGWQTGFDNIPIVADLMSTLNIYLPWNLLSTTSPRDTQESYSNYYKHMISRVLTLHLDRSQDGHCMLWRPVRQPWEVQFKDDIPIAWINSEGIGPQSSVAQDDDPQRLAMYAATSYLCGAGAFTLHTGAGIRAGGQEDINRGRSANLWEVPNIQETLDRINEVREILPANIQEGRKYNYSDHPGNEEFYPFDLQDMRDAEADGAICKAYCSIINNKYYLVILDNKNTTFRPRFNMYVKEHNLHGLVFASQKSERFQTIKSGILVLEAI